MSLVQQNIKNGSSPSFLCLLCRPHDAKRSVKTQNDGLKDRAGVGDDRWLDLSSDRRDDNDYFVFC